MQLARSFGAGRVIATASSEDKRALALELGADAAVDVTREDLADALLEANGGAPVDVVLEPIGGRVFDASLDALAPFGRLVVYGISSRESAHPSTGHLMKHSKAVVGFWLYHCLAEPERLVAGPLADLLARAAARRAASARGRDLPAVGRPPGARGPRRTAHDREAPARSTLLKSTGDHDDVRRSRPLRAPARRPP